MECTKIIHLQMARHFNNYSEKNLDNPFSSDLSKQRDHKCCIERNKSKILLGFWKTVLSNQENDNGSSDSPSQDAFLWGVGSKCFYRLHFFKYFIRFIKQISFIKKNVCKFCFIYSILCGGRHFSHFITFVDHTT